MTDYTNKPIDMNSDYVKKVQAGILSYEPSVEQSSIKRTS